LFVALSRAPTSLWIYGNDRYRRDTRGNDQKCAAARFDPIEP
jgi:hypothetical protein